MALQTNAVKLMELADVKVAKLLTDVSSAPTYDSLVNLSGALKLTISPKSEMKKLYGDSELKDVYSRVTEIEIDGECTVLSLDALKIMLGGTVTASGTTPNQKQTFALTSATATLPFFKIEGKWTYAGEGLGDAHVVLYKCKVSDAPAVEINDASGAFGTIKFKAIALPATANGAWYDLVLNETAASIA